MTGPSQPGGRAPAPGQLAVVQAFINTHFDLEESWGADVLASPAALTRWLARHGLATRSMRADRASLARALELREGLRALSARNGNGTGRDPHIAARLDTVAAGAPSEVRFGRDGPRFVPGAAGVSGALGALVAMTAAAMIEGSWWRLKVCPGEHCGWAFYDASRNQTGRWCSMSVCGGRAKARAHYQRSRGGAG